MPTQPPAGGARIVGAGEHVLSPAGVQGQLEARVAVHVGDGAKRVEVLSREHVQVDIDDAVDSANGSLFCFADGYGWAMELAWFIPAAAQVELSRSRVLFFSFVRCVRIAYYMVQGPSRGGV